MKAVILAAGMGTRLRPITDLIPKCLVEINNTSILEQALKNLSLIKIDEIIIVVGYLRQQIIQKIGNSYESIPIRYVINDDYANNNSMYSLWLGLKDIADDIIVIEGDCLFEQDILINAVNSKNNIWIADRFTKELNGSMLVTDCHGKIIEQKIVKSQLSEYKTNFFKSAGLLCLKKEYVAELYGWLEKDVENGSIKDYYDTVISKNLDEKDIFVFNISGYRWYEVDTISDLKVAKNVFGPRKYVIIVADGSADFPIPELENKTPYEVANIQNIDNIAKIGVGGTLKTSFDGLPVGSIVANMGILGYDPNKYHPNGRASFEALAQGLSLCENDVCFRCNFISLKDHCISDFTADWISDDKAIKLITKLELPKDLELYSGQSYRNLLIWRGAPFKASDIICFEPHMHIDEDISNLLIRGLDSESQKAAQLLNTLLFESLKQIKEINKEVKSKADMIWLWSPSSTPFLPQLFDEHKITGAVVAGLDFMRGIGQSVGMVANEITGATGFSDTNLNEKMKYAINYILNHDLVFIHINAPDEESHKKNITNKVKAIEKIDSEIIGPIFSYLEENYKNNYRLLFLPDHYTLLKDGTHNPTPVPFVVCGYKIKSNGLIAYSETEIAKISKNIVNNSYDFFKKFISEKTL